MVLLLEKPMYSVQIRTSGGKVVRARETGAARTDDDDIGDGALVHLGEVPIMTSRYLTSLRDTIWTHRLIMARETWDSSIGAKR